MKNKIYIKLLFIFIFIITLNSCNSTKEEILHSQKCKSQIKIIKNKRSFLMPKNKGLKVDKGNHFYIYFTEGYKNDKISAYINNKLLFNEILITDESLGTTEKGFYYNYKSSKKPVILKITKNGNESCFKIILDKKFRQLFINSYDNNKWEVIYDNIYPLYE